MKNNIVIIGAGPTGLITSLLLAEQGYKVSLIESNSEDLILEDTKALAISKSTVFILKKLNIWELLAKKAIAINEIHVSQKKSFGRTLLRARDFDDDFLGQVISYPDLIESLRSKTNKLDNTEIFFNSYAKSIHELKGSRYLLISQGESEINIPYDLLVMADGGQSTIKGIDMIKEEKEDNHLALVAALKSNKRHNGRAFERFTKNGPIALIPNKFDKYTLIWTGPAKVIKRIKELNNTALLDELQQNFGNRAGIFEEIEVKRVYPLKNSILKKIKNQNIIAIGNAAQTIHPVAGQGLNIGIRDAFELSKIIKNPDILFPTNISKEFNKIRQSKSNDVINITNKLSTIFLSDIVGFNFARGISLSIFDAIPFLKKKFVRKMSYGE